MLMYQMNEIFLGLKKTFMVDLMISDMKISMEYPVTPKNAIKPIKLVHIFS